MHPTELADYYIGRACSVCSAARLPTHATPRSRSFGSNTGPAAISPCTITMDHDAIICSMIDRLARGPDQDVHVPSVGSQKYPSYNVDVIYL